MGKKFQGGAGVLPRTGDVLVLIHRRATRMCEARRREKRSEATAAPAPGSRFIAAEHKTFKTLLQNTSILGKLTVFISGWKVSNEILQKVCRHCVFAQSTWFPNKSADSAAISANKYVHISTIFTSQLMNLLRSIHPDTMIHCGCIVRK